MDGKMNVVPQLNDTTARNSRGFTLIELLLATFLFAVALLGIASLATVVIKGNSVSQKITTSTLLCQQKMEYYLTRGYSNYTTGTFLENYGSLPAADGSTTLYSGYKRSTVVANGPATNTRKVTVTVTRKSDNISTSFSTLFAK